MVSLNINHLMSTFIIDVPMPAMGATVSELTIINLVLAPGAIVTKGQKLAEMESDKSAFDFESPGAGTVLEVHGRTGQVKLSGQSLFRLETSDESLRHLEVKGAVLPTLPVGDAGARAGGAAWTPRAIKIAQEAGFDHGQITNIEATGPGGRVSGDDVTKYLAGRK